MLKSVAILLCLGEKSNKICVLGIKKPKLIAFRSFNWLCPRGVYAANFCRPRWELKSVHWLGWHWLNKIVIFSLGQQFMQIVKSSEMYAVASFPGLPCYLFFGLHSVCASMYILYWTRTEKQITVGVGGGNKGRPAGLADRKSVV